MIHMFFTIWVVLTGIALLFSGFMLMCMMDVSFEKNWMDLKEGNLNRVLLVFMITGMLLFIGGMVDWKLSIAYLGSAIVLCLIAFKAECAYWQHKCGRCYLKSACDTQNPLDFQCLTKGNAHG